MAHQQEDPDPEMGVRSILPMVLVALAAFGLIAMLSPRTTDVKASRSVIRETVAPGPVPVTDRRPTNISS